MTTTIVRASVALLCLTLVAASDRPAAETPSRGTSLSREELAKLDGRLGIVARRDRFTGEVDGWLEGTIYNGTDRVIRKVVVLRARHEGPTLPRDVPRVRPVCQRVQPVHSTKDVGRGLHGERVHARLGPDFHVVDRLGAVISGANFNPEGCNV
jgi:hypothetical protein